MTDELRGRIREWYNRAKGYPTWEQAYNEIKPPISLPRFRQYMGEMGGRKQEYTYRETDGGAEVESASKRIKTLDDLIAACHIDLSMWEVERFEIRHYETSRAAVYRDLDFDKGKVDGHITDAGDMHVEPMTSIKAWLKRRSGIDVGDTLLKVADRIARVAPTRKALRPVRTAGNVLFAPQIYDVHFGKRSITHHSIEDAAREMVQTAEALIERALFFGPSIERVLFPVGNDAFHVDS